MADTTALDLLGDHDVQLLQSGPPCLVQLATPTGELLVYVVTVEASRSTLRKVDLHGGETWTVTLRAGLPAACSCPDFRFRRLKLRQWCKHMAGTYLALYPPFED